VADAEHVDDVALVLSSMSYQPEFMIAMLINVDVPGDGLGRRCSRSTEWDWYPITPA